jgi:long-chain fatty acid transport protein
VGGPVIALALQLTLAAGFAVPEQSARAVGMGGVGVAAATGAATVYYNPGSVAFEDGVAAELSGTLIAPSFHYESPAGAGGDDVEPSLFALPSVFAEVPLTDAWYVGLGAFSNYGLGLRWPATFKGRFESQSASITTFTFNPTAAYRIDEHWGVGVGLDVVRGTVELSQRIDFSDSEGLLRMGGGAWGTGVNAGVSSRWLRDDLVVGLSYRSAVALIFRGRADFSVPRELEASLRDQDVTTHLTLPHTVAAGASYRVTPDLRGSVELTYTTWSSLDALHIDFAESDALDQELPRRWNNTLTARAGAEYALKPNLSLRAGLGYDPSPSPADTLSPSLPDANRLLFSAGAGYRLGNFTVDLGYLLVLVTARDSAPPAFPAHYSGTAHLIGLGVGFRQ